MKFLIAVISYMFISLALAYPWHLIWFHELYVTLGAVTREPPIVPLGITSLFIQGVIIAVLYPYFRKGRHPVIDGVLFSWVMGLMVWSVMGPATAAKFTIEPVMTFLAYHSVFQFLQFTITGIALGLIYGRKRQVQD